MRRSYSDYREEICSQRLCDTDGLSAGKQVAGILPLKRVKENNSPQIEENMVHYEV